MPKDVRNLLIERIVEGALERSAARYASGKLLDIGCGSKPYERIYAPYVSEHIGVDHANSLHRLDRADRIGTAYAIPAADQEFDTVICTAVLEHLEEPEEALRECHRVLKAGGYAIYCVPFIWHLHEEPRDFFRFSKYGLRYLFEKTGFEVAEITALSGFWVTFGQLLVYNLYRLNRGPARKLGLLTPLALGIQGLAWGLNKVDRTEQWTWMYMVAAKRV